MSRTSQTHPLRIDPVRAGNGLIGVTFCPGKRQPDAMTGSWARDLEMDLDAIVAWGATHLVTLIEPFEFEQLEVPNLGERAQAKGLTWHHAPIVDDAIPDERFQTAWPRISPILRQALANGERVVIHCKGGLGRAGTVACQLMLEQDPGLYPLQALEQVRQARPGAVYVQEQEDYLRQTFARP